MDDTSPEPDLDPLITCPYCGAQHLERMPTDVCQYFYQCNSCQPMIEPKPGDCCVYCSYGTVKCPPVQGGARCC